MKNTYTGQDVFYHLKYVLIRYLYLGMRDTAGIQEVENMKVIVIGGCGHIGSYLVPKLVDAGYKTTVISRGLSKPYFEDPAWEKVNKVILDRNSDDAFANKIAAMNADIVVDLINFSLDETVKMVDALKETRLSHYLFCSTIWTHGHAEFLPASDERAGEPIDQYGTSKYECDMYLKEQYRMSGFPCTLIKPGHISGPGWIIINPFGNTDVKVFQDIADGKEICLPNFGMETLHHIHANDVAQLFMDAITHRNRALGESFYAVANDAMTLYGYAKAMYRFFGREPQIKFLSWEKWCEYMKDEEQITMTYNHIARSGYFSNERAKIMLNYRPRYSALDTVIESVKGYIDRRIINI